MNTSKYLSLRGLFCGLIALFMTVGAFAETPLQGPGQSVWTLSVPAGLSVANVQEAVVATFYGRAWAIQEKGDGKVVGYLKHRSNEALVTITYNDKTVEAFCVGYEINKKTGERKKPELPSGWLNFLKGDLTKKLNQATVSK
jgi:hypothetical protein